MRSCYWHKNSLVAVVKDSNGAYWYLGKTRGLDVTAGTAGTGTAQGDRSGFTLTLQVLNLH